MRGDLVFPVDCSYLQPVHRKYGVKGGWLTVVDLEEKTQFNAFADHFTFRSLVELTRRKPSEAAALKWVSEYGFLTVPYTADLANEELREPVEDFWEEARRLVYLWRLYQQVLDRSLDELKTALKMEEVGDPFWGKMAVFSLAPRATTNEVAAYYQVEISEALESIEKDPLRFYELAAFQLITWEITSNLEGLSVSANAYRTAESGCEKLTMKPYLVPANLLQTLYLQFCLLINDKSKKICASCGTVFTPTRPNQDYCSQTCKNTAKSRRWRKRQEEKAGKLKQGRSVHNG